MKIPRLIFGLWFIAATGLLTGASSPDGQFSTAPRKESPSMSDKGKGSSSPDAPAMESGGQSRLDDMVEIIGVTQQKPDASGSRKVTVRVRYALVHYPKGVLSLGFNLKSPTHYVQVTNQPMMAGQDEMDLSATIVPVTWPKDQPFKLYVSLSAEPHPGQWSLLAAESQAMKPADGGSKK